MADDGGWPKLASAEPVAPGDERTRVVMGELRTVLGELERRLAAAPAQSPETLAALAHSLGALNRQIARNEAAAQNRARELAAAVGSMTQYLEIQTSAQAAREDQLTARLDRLLIELEHMRVVEARRRADPTPVRVVLAGASLAALLSLVGAGVVAVTRPEALPHLGASPIAAAEPAAPNS